jgi:hypothetical protein
MYDKGQLWRDVLCEGCGGTHDLYLADDRRYQAGMVMAYLCPTTGQPVDWSTTTSAKSVTYKASSFVEIKVA